MADTWVTDLRHFLDESGEVPDLPGPAMNIAVFTGAIAAWVTGRDRDKHESTNVACRRSPGHRRCRGEIVAGFHEDSTITWVCPICGDTKIVRGWEGTRWDRSSDL